MTSILDQIAASRFSYDAGSAGQVTVPAKCFVTNLIVHGGNNATVTIAPGGPNQTGQTGPAIPIPNSDVVEIPFYGQLGPGTVFTFTLTNFYVVMYAQFLS